MRFAFDHIWIHWNRHLNQGCPNFCTPLTPGELQWLKMIFIQTSPFSYQIGPKWHCSKKSVSKIYFYSFYNKITYLTTLAIQFNCFCWVSYYIFEYLPKVPPQKLPKPMLLYTEYGKKYLSPRAPLAESRHMQTGLHMNMLYGVKSPLTLLLASPVLHSVSTSYDTDVGVGVSEAKFIHYMNIPQLHCSKNEGNISSSQYNTKSFELQRYRI